MSTQIEKSNFKTLFLVTLVCILTGGFIGAITNMINGAISQNYFKIIMKWDFDDIWIATVAQGIFEGLIYGVIFSIIFTMGFGILTKGQASFKFAMKQLIRVVAFIFFVGLLAEF